MRTVVDPVFRAELVNRIVHTGTSQAALARDAHVSPGYLSEIINGHKTPSATVAQALDDALAAGGELATLVHPFMGDDDTDQFTAATINPYRADTQTADSLARVLAAQRGLDDTIGSAALIKPVTAQLDQISTLVTHARGPHRPALVNVGAQWAQFAGWLNVSTGQWNTARTWFSTALQWATEAGDRDMIATVLSYQGHVAWLTCQPGSTIGLAEAALRDDTVFPGQRAYDAFQAARGHAVIGELNQADSLIGLGNRLADETDTYTGPVPAWQYYRQPWFWDLERGLVHRYAARHQPGRIRAAVDLLRNGLASCPTEWQQADWYAEYVVHHATALTDAGDLDDARAELRRARSIAEAVQSRRILAMVTGREGRLAGLR